MTLISRPEEQNESVHSVNTRIAERDGVKSAFHDRREIRPLLNSESPNVANRFGEPCPAFQRLNRQKKVGHIFIFRNIKTPLNTTESMLSKNGSNFCVGLRDAFGVMLFSLIND